MANYLNTFRLVYCIALASFFVIGNANAQSRAPAAPMVRPAPAPPMVEPAPAPPMVQPAPAPPMEQQAPSRAQNLQAPSSGQWPINGVYQTACGSSQLPGTAQTLSFRNHLSVADGFGRVQWATQFFLGSDCSGSLYAAYIFPVRSTQYVGQRAVNLPDTGQTVTGTLHLGQPAAAPLQVYGAAMQMPNNIAMVGIVVNGVQTYSAPVNQRVDEERFLVHATRSGLYLLHNRESGASLDTQGFPTRFVHGTPLVRVQ